MGQTESFAVGVDRLKGAYFRAVHAMGVETETVSQQEAVVDWPGRNASERNVCVDH